MIKKLEELFMFSKKSKVFKKAVTLGMCALMAVSSFGMSASAFCGNGFCVWGWNYK